MLLKVAPLFLLASAVLAVPSGLASRVARSRTNHQPARAFSQLDGTTPNEQYTDNWAGAVLSQYSSNTVTGTFIAPLPLGNEGDSGAIWVGIFGDNCSTTALLQTGIAFTVTSGEPTYDALYEFVPAPADHFPPSDITIKPRDVIRLTVTAFSSTSGTVMIENLSSSQTVSMDLTSPPSSSLCGQNVAWIVEDFSVDSQLVPLANFGTVVFMNASAGTHLPADARTIDIKQDEKVLTASSISGSNVTVQYIGN